MMAPVKISPSALSCSATQDSRERVTIVAAVVTLHLAVLYFTMTQMQHTHTPVREIKITIEAPAKPTEPVALPTKPVPPRVAHSKPPKLKSAKAAKPKKIPKPAPVTTETPRIDLEREAARLKAEQEAAQVRAANEATISFAAEEGLPQVQVGGYGPTNKAPSYPHMARRMGLQGKVVLNVEVLANGSCGQINIAQSSGHAALDNNALSAVKTWHFIPATQAGKAINKWHQVPIIFSLKDN